MRDLREKKRTDMTWSFRTVEVMQAPRDWQQYQGLLGVCGLDFKGRPAQIMLLYLATSVAQVWLRNVWAEIVRFGGSWIFVRLL